MHLLPNSDSPCVFTKGLPLLAMPVRHGEGKLIPRDEECLRRIAAEQLIALQYADPESGKPTQEYPYNPNGSPLAIAGLADPTGRVLGLMPHPEAFHHVTNHPAWTRGELDPPGTLLVRQCRALSARPVAGPALTKPTYTDRISRLTTTSCNSRVVRSEPRASDKVCTRLPHIPAFFFYAG